MSLREDLIQVVGEVNALYFERETETRMIVLGLLAGQHTLLLGPPGTGKSAVARELAGRLVGGEYFEVLLHKFIEPSAVFGSLDLAAMMGEDPAVKQDIDGYAATANLVFLDEIFKCSSAALNGMLSFLNERLYHPMGRKQPVRCPLISAVCASNELAEDETTAALYDRLLIRMEVGYLEDADSFDALLGSAVAGADGQPTRTRVELADLQKVVGHEVPAIGLPRPVREAIRDLRADLRRREIIPSDRRWKQTVRLLQASAWLAGRPEIAAEDLAVLEHVLWDEPAQRSSIARLLRGYLSPDDRELADLADEIERISAELDQHIADGNEDALAEWALEEDTNLLQRQRTMRGLLTAAEAAGRDITWHRKAVDRAQQVYTRLMVEALGMAEANVTARLDGGAR